MSRTVNWHSRYWPPLDSSSSAMGTAPSIRQVAMVCRRLALGRGWWPIMRLVGADHADRCYASSSSITTATTTTTSFQRHPAGMSVSTPQPPNGKTLKQNIPDGCDVTGCAFSGLSADCHGRFDMIRFDLRGQVAELPTATRACGEPIDSAQFVGAIIVDGKHMEDIFRGTGSRDTPPPSNRALYPLYFLDSCRVSLVGLRVNFMGPHGGDCGLSRRWPDRR